MDDMYKFKTTGTLHELIRKFDSLMRVIINRSQVDTKKRLKNLGQTVISEFLCTTGQ